MEVVEHREQLAELVPLGHVFGDLFAKEVVVDVAVRVVDGGHGQSLSFRLTGLLSQPMNAVNSCCRLMK